MRSVGLDVSCIVLHGSFPNECQDNSKCLLMLLLHIDIQSFVFFQMCIFFQIQVNWKHLKFSEDLLLK